MDRYTLPQSWQSLSEAALLGRLDEINSLAAQVDIDAPATDDTPAGVDVLESLADARDAINGELAGRAESSAAAEERRAAVAARFAPVAAEPEVAAEVDPEPEPEPEPETAPVAEDPEPEPEPEVAPEPEPELVGASLATQPVPASQVTAAMNRRRTPTEMPRPSSDTRNGRMRSVGQVGPDGFQAGDFFADIDAVSEHFAQRINSVGRGEWGGPSTNVPLISSQWQFSDNELLSASDIERNFRVMDEAGRNYRAEQDSLVASGGPCAPLMPTYEFFSCYSPQRPVEAGLPVVGAPRGGIRFLNPVPLGADSAGAITLKDAAASALVPPAYTAKNCTRVSCPTETTVTVGSVSWCVTFDNLNFRVFPEQVRNMLERVQIEFTKAKEIRYLNRMDTIAGAAVDVAAAQSNPFGAGRSLFRDLMMIGHNYRKRNNMNKDSILDVWLPDVVEDILAVDMVNDYEMGGMGSIVGGPNGNLAAALTQRARMNVNWYYYDSTNAGFPASGHTGAGGTWRPFPTKIRSYVYSPGSMVRLDAGQLDLGIVRDSVLNGTNDLQMFAEQWIEVAHPGCEIRAFDHTLCYSGVGPLGVAAPACP